MSTTASAVTSRPRTDKAIRGQVLRDLVEAPERTVERERSKVALEGWGARLLALQNPEGTWAGGLYTPKWTSTTYTMLLPRSNRDLRLRDFGLPANNRQARKACKLLLDGGLQPDGGVNYGAWAQWTRRGETCVTGMVLSLLSYFEYDDDRLDVIAEHLSRVSGQMPDGGWNCRRPQGATHASVHTSKIPIPRGRSACSKACRRSRSLGAALRTAPQAQGAGGAGRAAPRS